MKYCIWTFYEERTLKRLAGNCRLSKISNILGRSPSSIKKKADALGISLSYYTKHWSKEDIQKLESFSNGQLDISIEDFAKSLNRSVKSVYAKSARLGLKMKSPKQIEDDSRFRQIHNLRYEGLTWAEITAVLGSTRSKNQSLYYSKLNQLKSQINSEIEKILNESSPEAQLADINKVIMKYLFSIPD